MRIPRRDRRAQDVRPQLRAATSHQNCGRHAQGDCSTMYLALGPLTRSVSPTRVRIPNGIRALVGHLSFRLRGQALRVLTR